MRKDVRAMARRVDKFPEVVSKSIYPWDEWLDGSIWELSPGEDFKGNIRTFRSVALGQAKRRGGKVTPRHLKERGGHPARLYIQFIHGTQQQQIGYGGA